MRSLISLALVSLPLSSAGAQTGDAAHHADAAPLTRRSLVTRSVQPDLTHRILHRSTGLGNPTPPARSLTSTVVVRGVDAAVASASEAATPPPPPRAAQGPQAEAAEPLAFRPAATPDRKAARPAVPIPHADPQPMTTLPDPAGLSTLLEKLPPRLPSASVRKPSPDLDHRVLERLDRYETLIERYSRMHDLEPNLVRAVIYVESAGEPYARSRKGAQGLMQLMPGTASDMGVSNPVDPAQSIYGGTRYLSQLIERFASLDLALWGYNAGPETVERRRLPQETRRYVPAVLRVKTLLDEQEGT